MSSSYRISTSKLERLQKDAKTLNFYRENPVIACEDLLGIYLSDAQAWMLASTWNTSRAVWACSRNFGKSFLIVIYCLLRGILYPNQNIYIVSSVGVQAKETFNKLEEIVLRLGKTSESSPDLKDIAAGEVAVSPTNKDGFKHDPSGYSVTFYNGSRIETLNSKPSNARGKRSSLTVFDEGAFCNEDLIEAVEPFSAQSSDSKYGKNTAKLKGLTPSQPYNQIIYASSQDDMDTIFYKRYKEYAKYMLAGDYRYFVCDMPCDTAITMYHKGEQIPSLLSQDVVDKAMRDDPESARKEYYNKPDMTGGEAQIIKWNTIRKNERQILPFEEWRPDNRIVLAFDPARTADNSVLSVMNLYEDGKYGLCGDIIACNNFIDIASKNKYKLDSNRQLHEIRNILLAYNGNNLDYEYIDSMLIDAGSGGGGQSTYADQLLNDWVDDSGKKHCGLIDASNELYTNYRKRYPNAIDKLRLISPIKYRTKMVNEFIELMELGVIRFPYAYSGSDILHLIKDVKIIGKDEDGNPIKEEETETYYLSQDEKTQLTQIDFMKREIASIHKSSNAENTSVTYALAKEKANKMHDDRFYTVIMLAHRLYELRRGVTLTNKHAKRNVADFIKIRPPKIL